MSLKSVNLTIESQCLSLLEKYFGYKTFRKYQLEIILNIIMNNCDSLVIMATGSGKSLCYQMPAIYKKKTAIVISPLISLIQNQVSGLVSKGIKAIAITGATNYTQQEYKDAFENNKYLIIYLTPEGVQNKLNDINILYKKHGLSCIAIDESHCVSEWGHDFRPHYKLLYKLRDNLSNVPIIALTATATPFVQNEIISILQLNKKNVKRFISSFYRPNLSYIVKEKKCIKQDLCYLQNANFYKNGSTIIYTSTQKKCEEIAYQLNRCVCFKNKKAAYYHGGMNYNQRNQIQSEWEQGKIQCIVATIAFGMGIDKPDIRYVIHYGVPDSIEAYYQHTGRAGRDNLPSICLLFWSKSDFQILNWKITKANSTINQERILKQTQKMKEFIYTNKCRVQYILQYFGENFNRCRSQCDNCLLKNKTTAQNSKNRDFTLHTKLLLICCSETGQRFGITTIADILRGKTNNKQVKKFPWLKNKSFFGKLSEKSTDWIRALYRKVVELGYMKEVWISHHNIRSNTNKTTFISKKGYQCPTITNIGFEVINNDTILIPPWIPEKDMLKAEKRK